MQIGLTLIFAILLGLVVYYDLKYLAIPVAVLLSLIVVSGIRLFLLNSSREALQMAIINVLGSLLIISISFLIIMIGKRKFINPLNNIIGTGDLIFFIVLCLSFSPLNFLGFMIVSFILALLFRAVFPKRYKIIPLAGIQAISLVIVLLLESIINYKFFSDQQLLNLLLVV